MENNICQKCGSTILAYEKTFHLQSEPRTETLCSECFSRQMAGLAGVQLEEMTPHTIEVSGRGRKKHLFYIDRIVFPMGISLEATEIQEGEPKGYKTAVHGDLDCDQAILLEKLLKKVKKLVSRKYIEEEKTEWGKRNNIKNREVAGRIEWDEQYEGKLPLVVIDGKEYTWEELGEMMMSFEGWDFKLKIFESWEDDID